MAKLVSWDDLFKFNKTLLEDDYNPGQKLVVKAAQKSDDGKYVTHTSSKQLQDLNTTTKVGQADGEGNHKVANEVKLKGSGSLGVQVEATIKLDGTLVGELKSDILQVIIIPLITFRDNQMSRDFSCCGMMSSLILLLIK